MHVFNARDEEISRDIIIKSRKDLLNSVHDIEGEKAVDVLNNIVRSFETEEEEEGKRIDENLIEKIKKDNQQFLTKTEETTSEKTFFEIPLTPQSSPTETLADLLSNQQQWRSLKHNKKPYNK